MTIALSTVGGGLAGYLWPELEPAIKILLWKVPLIVLSLTLVFGFLSAPYTLHKEIVIRESKDYVKYDINARLDKVHRIFYHLHREGEQTKNSSDKRVAAWDEEVIKAFTDYCHRDVLNTYLMNSGRASQMKPLEMRTMDWALGYIKEKLDYDDNLRNRLKPV